MKILATNFLKFTNKIYFSGIQNNNHTTPKQKENKEQLPKLDILTSRIYYKTINNSITFNGSNNKEAEQNEKRQKEQAILQELEDAILAGKSKSSFCREKGYKKDKIKYLLEKYKEKGEKIKQKRKEIMKKEETVQQKKREAILKDLEEYLLSGKKIADFCRERGYTRSQIGNLLDKHKETRQKIRQAKQKEEELLLKELKEYLAAGKTMEDFYRTREDKIQRIKYILRRNKKLREEIKGIKRQARLEGKTQGQRIRNSEYLKEKLKKRELIFLDLEIAHSLGMTTEEFCKQRGYNPSTINLLIRRFKKAEEEIEKQSSSMPNRTWLTQEDFDNRIFGHKKLMNVSLSAGVKQQQQTDKINKELKDSFPDNTVFWIEDYDVSNIGKYPLEKYTVKYRIYKSPDNKKTGYFGTKTVKELKFISNRKNAYKTFINNLIKYNKGI